MEKEIWDQKQDVPRLTPEQEYAQAVGEASACLRERKENALIVAHVTCKHLMPVGQTTACRNHRDAISPSLGSRFYVMLQERPATVTR